MPELGFHGFYADEDADGWFSARCSCGWTVGAFPDVTDAADAWGDHRANVAIAGFAEDMRAQGIHVGLGEAGRCVTCHESWPCSSASTQ